MTHLWQADLIRLPAFLSLAEWCLFVIYWRVAAKNASPAKASESRGSRLVHEVLVNSALLLIFLQVPGLRQRFLPNASFVAAAGLAIQTASAMLAFGARRHLGSHWSGEITIKIGHELVRSSPYRNLRHPIYTAMLGMFTGAAVVSGQTHALVGLVVVTLAYWRKTRLEEANLRNAFGSAYEAYRRETWAWIPGLF